MKPRSETIRKLASASRAKRTTRDERSAFHAKYIGTTDPQELQAQVEEIFDKAAFNEEGNRLPPEQLLDSGEDAWEVEAVVGKRTRGRQVQYLVKWKGYNEWENTWEPSRNLRYAQDCIDLFESRLAAQQ